MHEVPKRFRIFCERYPDITAAYENLAAEGRRSGPLGAKGQALARLGVAVGAQIEGAVRSQARKALDAGLTPDEIRHAIMISLTTIGYPRMMAALTWSEDIIGKMDDSL
ncbi:MAG: carboxymuconolactone decarboxylase family protein [Acidobacteriota bacterium]|jgi:alkylhydroperoxidase/carboxymuconolactone decarboxylase family protein YurZ|nr:carboxymuconolactone decarboxylase family protein [Acidobacteriota bacterium]